MYPCIFLDVPRAISPSLCSMTLERVDASSNAILILHPSSSCLTANPPTRNSQPIPEYQYGIVQPPDLFHLDSFVSRPDHRPPRKVLLKLVCRPRTPTEPLVSTNDQLPLQPTVIDERNEVIQTESTSTTHPQRNHIWGKTRQGHRTLRSLCLRLRLRLRLPLHLRERPQQLRNRLSDIACPARAKTYSDPRVFPQQVPPTSDEPLGGIRRRVETEFQHGNCIDSTSSPAVSSSSQRTQQQLTVSSPRCTSHTSHFSEPWNLAAALARIVLVLPNGSLACPLTPSSEIHIGPASSCPCSTSLPRDRHCQISTATHHGPLVSLFCRPPGHPSPSFTEQ